MKGTIKKLNEKGFGFITPVRDANNPSESSKDLFFHANDCTERNFKDLQEGDMVTFEVGSSPKGPKATDVMLASREDADSDMDMAA